MASKLGGAWVLIISDDGKYVMVAKRSKGVNNPNMWNFWGGGMDEGEIPKQTAVRELFEESGIKVRKSDLSYLGTSNRLHFYTVKMAMKVRPPNIDPKETSSYRWIKLSSLVKNLRKFNPPSRIAILNIHLGKFNIGSKYIGPNKRK